VVHPIQRELAFNATLDNVPAPKLDIFLGDRTIRNLVGIVVKPEVSLLTQNTCTKAIVNTHIIFNTL